MAWRICTALGMDGFEAQLRLARLSAYYFLSACAYPPGTPAVSTFTLLRCCKVGRVRHMQTAPKYSISHNMLHATQLFCYSSPLGQLVNSGDTAHGTVA